MDIKNKDFVSNRVFSLKVSNLIALITVFTTVICAGKTLQLFLSLSLEDVYLSSFGIFVCIMLSIVCLIVYLFLSGACILGEASYLTRMRDIVGIDNKSESIRSSIDDVGLLILAEMDKKGYGLAREDRCGLCDLDLIEAKSLSSALYILGAISDKLSSKDFFDYHLLLNTLPDQVLNNVVKFCDFDFMTLCLSSSDGNDKHLLIGYSDNGRSNKQVCIKGCGVDKLVDEVLSIKHTMPNGEYKLGKKVDGGDNSKVVARIIISKKEISIKVK